MRLIDADELKQKMQDGYWDIYDNINEAIKMVDQAPTIEPVKRGHWKRFGAFACECSVCKIYVDVIDANNYCGNCGAKMDGDCE